MRSKCKSSQVRRKSDGRCLKPFGEGWQLWLVPNLKLKNLKTDMFKKSYQTQCPLLRRW